MRRLALTLFAVVLGGCNDNEPTGPHGAVTSIYVLRTINGASLPAAGNGSGMTDFTIIADTITVYQDFHAVEVLVTSRPGESGVTRREQELQFAYGPGFVDFDVEYPCKDQLAVAVASCIAPPHHRGARSSFDMTFTYSVMYRVPMVFERVGPILPE
jgi:hypothetical protein